jgi:sporulation protein YabP
MKRLSLLEGISMEEKKKVSELTHQLTMTNRNLLGVEGVLNLGSYDQEQILLETSSGVLEIKGDRLHVQQLNLDQGKVLVDGDIVSLVYTDETLNKRGKGFFGKLIK